MKEEGWQSGGSFQGGGAPPATHACAALELRREEWLTVQYTHRLPSPSLALREKYFLTRLSNMVETHVTERTDCILCFVVGRACGAFRIDRRNDHIGPCISRCNPIVLSSDTRTCRSVAEHVRQLTDLKRG